MHSRSFVRPVLSPVDLIPDFIPVLGQLDDLEVVAAGVWIAPRLIPQQVWQECLPQKSDDRLFRSIGRSSRLGGALRPPSQHSCPVPI